MKKVTNRPTKNYFSSKLQKLMPILHNAVLVTAQRSISYCTKSSHIIFLHFTQAVTLLLKDGSIHRLVIFGAVSDRHTKGVLFFLICGINALFALNSNKTSGG
jgi:hypothetical protein